MKTYKHISILASAVLLFCGCSADTDVLPHPGNGDPVTVNMTRAEGMTAGGNYSIMFWFGEKGKAALTSLASETPWFHSLDSAGVVSYNFGVRNYPVTKNNVQVEYVFDDSPIHALGFYPADSLSLSQDYCTLTLKGQPGLTDVCSTQIESGTQSAPFTDYKYKELQYAHTQVKLNFSYQRTENVNGRIERIRMDLDSAHLANKWVMTDTTGYHAQHDGTLGAKKLILASRSDFYATVPQEWPMYLSTASTDDVYTIDSIGTNPNVYVLPTTGLFSGEDGSQQYITFPLYALILSNHEGINDRTYNYTVKVPLTDKNGNPWTTKVKAGDAFDIKIIFDSKKIEILAQKEKWLKGNWLTIPIDPSK